MTVSFDDTHLLDYESCEEIALSHYYHRQSCAVQEICESGNNHYNSQIVARVTKIETVAQDLLCVLPSSESEHKHERSISPHTCTMHSNLNSNAIENVLVDENKKNKKKGKIVWTSDDLRVFLTKRKRYIG